MSGSVSKEVKQSFLEATAGGDHQAKNIDTLDQTAGIDHGSGRMSAKGPALRPSGRDRLLEACLQHQITKIAAHRTVILKGCSPSGEWLLRSIAKNEWPQWGRKSSGRSWPDAEVHLLTGSDGNRCIAAVDRSETNPILHKTDRMVSVPGNQVLHNTARLQGAC